MTAMILDGKAIAKQIRGELAEEVRKLGVKPCLAVVLVGDDPASRLYVRKKEEACAEVGIDTQQINLPADAGTASIVNVICSLNVRDPVHGILVQLPLPDGVDKFRVFDAIHPGKDVDVFTASNTGRLIQDRPLFTPCTPQAVREILVRSGIPIKGQHVVIVNRSLIVGQPLAHMLMQNGDFANATVTVCHEYTKNIKKVCRDADILVTAVGHPDKFRVTADMVKPGGVVIDVAIVRKDGKVFGDVDFPEVSKVAGYLSPVPGGVGPLTVAQLLKNAIQACKLQCSVRKNGYKGDE